jgi:hypothetical protein
MTTLATGHLESTSRAPGDFQRPRKLWLVRDGPQLRAKRPQEPYQNWATRILARYAGLPFACDMNRPPIPYPRGLRRRITREM